MIRRFRVPIPWIVQVEVRHKANNCCEHCGETFGLEFHHENYGFEEYPGQASKEGDVGWIFGRETASDLTLLCRQCHLAEHLVFGEFYWNPDEVKALRDQYSRY